jgi:TIR domain
MTVSTPATSGRIFICYRREETAYPAGWLYERLAERFGSGQVFKDVDSIQLGDDFVDVISRAVGSCDVLLALIGEHWLTSADEHGRPRLDDPDDFVRLEIQAALDRQVRVIPILVDGARMPRADELPDSLAKLVRRQALELTPSHFESDTGRLLRVIDWTLADVRGEQGEAAPAEVAPDPAPPATREAPATPPAGQDRRRRSARTWVLAGVGIVLVLLIAAVLVTRQGTPDAGGGLGVDPAAVMSGDGLRLTGLEAVSSPNPPSVGGTVTVSYSLTNASDQDIQLDNVFLAVRNEAGDNKDFELSTEARTLAPEETVALQGQVRLDSAGTWRLWPCYELSGGGQCPDNWQEFSVDVQ